MISRCLLVRAGRMGLVLVAVGLLSPLPGRADPHYVNSFAALRNAMLTADPYDEIIIAPGSYHVTSPLYVTTPNLTFRGATGNRDDVVLYGNGMNVNSGVLEGFWAAADGIRLESVTIRDFWHHGIHICGDGYADNVVISNVKTVNCGERHVKGSASSGISSNVLIENLRMEQTIPYLPRPGHSVDEYNYIGGIDAMHTDNWIIRDCVAKGIMGAAGGARAAFFLWNGVSNLLMERNTIVACGHGISIGNPSGPNNSHVNPWHAVGGIIRNNTILRADESDDNWAFELDNTKDFKVYNNTIYSADTTYRRTVQIYDDPSEGLTTNLDLKNNLIRGRVKDLSSGDWSSAAVAAMGNIVDTDGTVVLPEWFADWAGGDFHLTAASTAGAVTPVNIAAVLADVLEDYDQALRGNSPDLGADEIILIAGDATLDWQVELADLSALALHFDTPAGMRWNHGDFDGDSAVTLADLSILAFNWGVGTAAPVPEPATLVLLATGALAIRRRRAKCFSKRR